MKKLQIECDGEKLRYYFVPDNYRGHTPDRQEITEYKELILDFSDSAPIGIVDHEYYEIYMVHIPSVRNKSC